ncbi:hypothetical protein JCM16163A_48920 [Paenibacillus sp. YK5]
MKSVPNIRNHTETMAIRLIIRSSDTGNERLPYPGLIQYGEYRNTQEAKSKYQFKANFNLVSYQK